jgi:hypothetical protein
MAAHSESRKKILTIGVRATPDEKSKLKLRADAFGISMGELCRQSIFNSTPKSKTDQSAISELAISRADLGRLGGLLKGWLAGTFPQGVPTPQTQPDVVKLLRQIDAAQKQVLEAVSKVSAK